MNDNIEKCLKTYPVENLIFAAASYLETVKDHEPQYRKICSNFFGRDKYFKDFLPNTDDPEIKAKLIFTRKAIDEELSK